MGLWVVELRKVAQRRTKCPHAGKSKENRDHKGKWRFFKQRNHYGVSNLRDSGHILTVKRVNNQVDRSRTSQNAEWKKLTVKAEEALESCFSVSLVIQS